MSEYNTMLWNNGTDAGKELARKQKRKLTYMANIYVVKDPANPANEGGVFLYKFGKKIFDKLTAAMQPEFEDEEAIDPFDFWQGANFKLKAKNVAGYRNYDSSEFAAQSALLDDDDAMEAIWKKEYSLAELVAADQFKDYDTLKKRLDYVLGNKGTPKFPGSRDCSKRKKSSALLIVVKLQPPQLMLDSTILTSLCRQTKLKMMTMLCHTSPNWQKTDTEKGVKRPPFLFCRCFSSISSCCYVTTNIFRRATIFHFISHIFKEHTKILWFKDKNLSFLIILSYLIHIVAYRYNWI